MAVTEFVIGKISFALTRKAVAFMATMALIDELLLALAVMTFLAVIAFPSFQTFFTY